MAIFNTGSHTEYLYRLMQQITQKISFLSRKLIFRLYNGMYACIHAQACSIFTWRMPLQNCNCQNLGHIQRMCACSILFPSKILCHTKRHTYVQTHARLTRTPVYKRYKQSPPKCVYTQNMPSQNHTPVLLIRQPGIWAGFSLDDVKNSTYYNAPFTTNPWVHLHYTRTYLYV